MRATLCAGVGVAWRDLQLGVCLGRVEVAQEGELRPSGVTWGRAVKWAVEVSVIGGVFEREAGVTSGGGHYAAKLSRIELCWRLMVVE